MGGGAYAIVGLDIVYTEAEGVDLLWTFAPANNRCRYVSNQLLGLIITSSTPSGVSP